MYWQETERMIIHEKIESMQNMYVDIVELIENNAPNIIIDTLN